MGFYRHVRGMVLRIDPTPISLTRFFDIFLGEKEIRQYSFFLL
jgi:hypothetical protein